MDGKTSLIGQSVGFVDGDLSKIEFCYVKKSDHFVIQSTSKDASDDEVTTTIILDSLDDAINKITEILETIKGWKK